MKLEVAKHEAGKMLGNCWNQGDAAEGREEEALDVCSLCVFCF
jgi:hypothetical protein